jgi:uncharacterized delta-60 repeat protein
VAGYADSDRSGSELIRYNVDGSVDRSFAWNGIFSTESGFFIGNAIGLQPDGKSIGFGYGLLSTGTMWGFAVSRLDPDGWPDASFGINGRQVTPVGTNNNFGFAVSLQADGKILASGGRSDNSEVGDAAIVRYLDESSLAHSSLMLSAPK